LAHPIKAEKADNLFNHHHRRLNLMAALRGFLNLELAYQEWKKRQAPAEPRRPASATKWWSYCFKLRTDSAASENHLGGTAG
jgi:hypothetical protein